MLDCTVRVHAVARVQRPSCDRSRESLPEVDRSCAIKRSVYLKCTKPHAECAINSLQLRTSSQLSPTSDIEPTLFKSTLSNFGHRVNSLQVNSLQLRTSSQLSPTSDFKSTLSNFGHRVTVNSLHPSRSGEKTKWADCYRMWQLFCNFEWRWRWKAWGPSGSAVAITGINS